MIDREARIRAALLLRRFAAGRITNVVFDDEYPVGSPDPGVRAVGDRAWSLYSDFRELWLTPTAELRREIARWVVFLHSDAEYGWPPFAFISVRAPRWLNRLSGGQLHRRQDAAFARWAAGGEYTVWPFRAAMELTRAAARPKYLVGQRG